MRKLSRREYSLIIIAMVIITGFSTIKWVIHPLLDSYNLLNYRVEELQDLLQKSRSVIEEGRSYRRKLEEARLQLETYNLLYFKGDPDRVEIEMLKTIEHSLKESGIQLQSKRVDTEALPAQEGINRISSKLVFRCSLGQLIDFLNRLNQNEKFYMVRFLDIIREEGSEEMAISMKIEVLHREGE